MQPPSIYWYLYTPSNQHFKAFPVSQINSKTSFLYLLFKENSNFIFSKTCKVIYFSIFIIFIIIYLYIYIYIYIYSYIYIYMYIYMHLCTYLHINILKPYWCLIYQFWDKFSVSTFQGEFKFHSFKAMQCYLFLFFL